MVARKDPVVVKENKVVDNKPCTEITAKSDALDDRQKEVLDVADEENPKTMVKHFQAENTTNSSKDTKEDNADIGTSKDDKQATDAKNTTARRRFKGTKESRNNSNKTQSDETISDESLETRSRANNPRDKKEKVSDKASGPRSRSKNQICFNVIWCLVAVALVILGLRMFRKPDRAAVVVLRDEWYAKNNITSDADYRIKDDLDEADSLFHHAKPIKAMELFKQILVAHPTSPRALWGFALANDLAAKIFKKTRDEKKAMVAIKNGKTAMDDVIKCPDLPRGLLIMVLPRLIQEYVLNESYKQLDTVWRILSEDYTHYPEVRRLYGLELAKYSVTKKRAEAVLTEMLDTDPTDCVSMAMLCKIYLSRNKDNGKAVMLLQRAVDMDCEGVRTTSFYNQVGEAYMRLGQRDKANTIHNLGVARGLFLSRDQRPIHPAEVPLAARPWWRYEETTYERDLQLLETNWEIIRDEALNVLEGGKGGFQTDGQGVIDRGVLQKLVLHSNGIRNNVNCRKAPKTCQLVDTISDSTTLTRGHVIFSVLHPGTHLNAHCGPTNCRIRAHLGLDIPTGPRIRVANETRTWEEGKFIIFDDSFEHEIWHDGTSGNSLVLSVDFWHPDLTQDQRAKIHRVES